MRTLPGGTVISFDPEGFGWPTGVRAGSTNYVDNIAYHPNGLAVSAVYGNGRSYSLTLTARQQPERLRILGAPTIVDLLYGYDARRKITSITDYAESAFDRGFSYDPKGRLLTASGNWGTGSFKYDAADNLRQNKLGSRTVDVNYNTNKQVSQTKDSANGNVWQYYSHDAPGNVTSNGLLAFGYDFANQPTTVSGSASASYQYDGNLRRVKAVQGGRRPIGSIRY